MCAIPGNERACLSPIPAVRHFRVMSGRSGPCLAEPLPRPHEPPALVGHILIRQLCDLLGRRAQRSFLWAVSSSAIARASGSDRASRSSSVTTRVSPSRQAAIASCRPRWSRLVPVNPWSTLTRVVATPSATDALAVRSWWSEGQRANADSGSASRDGYRADFRSFTACRGGVPRSAIPARIVGRRRRCAVRHPCRTDDEFRSSVVVGTLLEWVAS